MPLLPMMPRIVLTSAMLRPAGPATAPTIWRESARSSISTLLALAVAAMMSATWLILLPESPKAFIALEATLDERATLTLPATASARTPGMASMMSLTLRPDFASSLIPSIAWPAENTVSLPSWRASFSKACRSASVAPNSTWETLDNCSKPAADFRAAPVRATKGMPSIVALIPAIMRSMPCIFPIAWPACSPIPCMLLPVVSAVPPSPFIVRWTCCMAAVAASLARMMMSNSACGTLY